MANRNGFYPFPISPSLCTLPPTFQNAERRMLTVLVASSKGGWGKSTLVTQLASHWAQDGKHTAIVDADRQQSGFRWAANRPDNVPGVLGIEGGRRALEKLPPDTPR